MSKSEKLPQQPELTKVDKIIILPGRAIHMSPNIYSEWPAQKERYFIRSSPARVLYYDTTARKLT